MTTKRQTQKKQQDREETKTCPICGLRKYLEEMVGGNTAFLAHMRQARMEFLKGIKSLVDSQVKAAEKRGTTNKERKMTKIDVED